MTMQQMPLFFKLATQRGKGEWTRTARFKSHNTKTIDPFSQKPTENEKYSLVVRRIWHDFIDNGSNNISLQLQCN